MEIIANGRKDSLSQIHLANSRKIELRPCHRHKDIDEVVDKQNELVKAGLDPEKLKINFYANESYDGDYYQCDAECEISFHYYRPETEEEKEERIKKAKKRIDEKIADAERKAEISRKNKERELQQAMEILKKNGFNVVSDK